MGRSAGRGGSCPTSKVWFGSTTRSSYESSNGRAYLAPTPGTGIRGIWTQLHNPSAPGLLSGARMGYPAARQLKSRAEASNKASTRHRSRKDKHRFCGLPSGCNIQEDSSEPSCASTWCNRLAVTHCSTPPRQRLIERWLSTESTFGHAPFEARWWEWLLSKLRLRQC